MNLTPFKELIKQRCGLTFEGVGEMPLVSGLQKRITATGAANPLAYYTRLSGDEHEFHELVCLLTINETYFYREPEQLRLLVDCLIPRILSRKQDASPVRILSAGCSTGEEPYSIAMALREKYGESATRLFMLAGGDIDKDALEKARIGRYTEFSFRSMAPTLCERYFERHGKWTRSVMDEVRHQVHFHHLNLLDESYPHELKDFDIIFFRNVSIYFDMSTRIIIQQRLATLMNDDGYLIIGTAETLANDLGVFSLVEEGGLFYFAKQRTESAGLNRKMPESAAPHKGVTDWILPAQVFSPSDASQPAAPLVREIPLSSPRPPVAASAGEARRLMREKRYDAALAVIVRLLEQQPDATDALLLKAHILLHRKEYAVAEEIAQRVLTTEVWSIDAFVVLALAAKWRNDAEGAVKWFKKAVYACNECWPAHYYLAELYRADNEMDKARRSYRVALQLLSVPHALIDGLSIIPLDLPPAEVRFLCEHQLAKFDSVRTAAVR